MKLSLVQRAVSVQIKVAQELARLAPSRSRSPRHRVPVRPFLAQSFVQQIDRELQFRAIHHAVVSVHRTRAREHVAHFISERLRVHEIQPTSRRRAPSFLALARRARLRRPVAGARVGVDVRRVRARRVVVAVVVVVARHRARRRVTPRRADSPHTRARRRRSIADRGLDAVVDRRRRVDAARARAEGVARVRRARARVVSRRPARGDGTTGDGGRDGGRDGDDDDDGDGGRGVVDRAHHRARARGAARSRRRARAVERGRAGRPRRRPRRRRRRKGGSRVHGQVRDGDDVFPARARRSRERGGGARARGRRVSGRRAPTRSTRGRRRRRAVEARQTRRDLERGHRGVVRRRLREIVRRDGRSARSTRIDSVTRLGVG